MLSWHFIVFIAILVGMWLFRLFKSRPRALVPPGILKGPDTFIPVKLSEVFPISDNTKVFRFELPDDSLPLGLPLCQHILFRAKIPTKNSPEGEEIIRKYTPTSRLNDVGFFEVPIKIYSKSTHPEFPDGGIMTQYLDSLRIGDKIDISGPRGRIIYNGGGEFSIENLNGKTEKKARNIGFIAGGTGITPCLQLIQYAATNSNENLYMSLIFANQTENDILLRPLIEEFVAEQKLFVYYILTKAPEGWPMGTGYISESHIKENMPPPGPETLIFHCGPKPFNILTRQLLEKLGYTDDMICKF
ncbi:CYB5R3 [Blepharisma stoltei]|uniref:NADH-cytochrome b5 reductase n=1 Tax=Blepharisma stoltei TaxID=1481888 RepID=A0AAU9K581_9CILI|nr:unnamed protein product [Blepharisma stoltei]